MSLIRFTENYDDLSTDRGYQFKFLCDRCRNGVMSSFQASALGTAAVLFRAAGDLSAAPSPVPARALTTCSAPSEVRDITRH